MFILEAQRLGGSSKPWHGDLTYHPTPATCSDVGANTVAVPPFIPQEQANPAAAGATHFDVNFVWILYGWLYYVYAILCVSHYLRKGICLPIQPHTTKIVGLYSIYNSLSLACHLNKKMFFFIFSPSNKAITFLYLMHTLKSRSC